MPPVRSRYDAVVIGSGPNGLAAAVTLALAGKSVLVLEAAPTPGGGMRTAELTLPGFHHDVCSAVHPFGVGSPFFRSLPLSPYGLEWIHPPSPVAHPLDDGEAVLLERSVDETAARLGADGAAYRRLYAPLVANAEAIFADALGPLRIPRHPWLLGRLGLRAARSASGLARRFRGAPARALFAGIAGHSILPLERWLSAAPGVMLALAAHAVGWPIARGGSASITRALVELLVAHGGEVVTGWRVQSLAELPAARVVLFDTIPRELVRIAGEALPARYRRRLARFRHGPGVFKLDWALSGPVPWTNPRCARAATVHVGGTFEELAAAEAAPWQGRVAERPFVLFVQPSLFDQSRAPEGKHVGWGYCHVPPGSTEDATERIEAQIERFAPGFRARILARHAMPPAAMEAYNSSYLGGDISGGVMDVGQLFTRPAPRISPYRTPNPALYLCSSSTPPGPGVHGMGGYFAARDVLAARLR